MSYKINYTTEEKIKLAKDDSVEKLYQSKKNQRTVRVMTVMAYILTVSLAGLVLSCYYVFFWNSKSAKMHSGYQNMLAARANCGSYYALIFLEPFHSTLFYSFFS
jgi:hypothetical protein